MKVIERIAKLSYWTTIIFMLIVIILIPIMFVNIPDSFEKLTLNNGMNPYNLTLSILSFAPIFLWGYCLWFWYKNDNYSKSIFPLLLLNWLYAPIYYYQVKIKKRPLKNIDLKPKQTVKEDKSITDQEFIELTRKNILDVLQLWASKEEQIEYQENFPNAEISKELFAQWNDFYTPDSDVLTDAFNPQELKLLKEFDKELIKRSYNLDSIPTDIKKYIETDDWKTINSLAKKILIDMK